MNRLLASLLAAFGFRAAETSPNAPANVMAELRAKALAAAPSDLGLPAGDYTQRPWGILMETATDEGAFSLVVLADGTTSLYFSRGGGILGAGRHETVRAAGRSLLEIAARAKAYARPASSTPLPRPGATQFYFLCTGGPLGYSADESALGNGADPLSELFHAGHAVIARVRETQTERTP